MFNVISKRKYNKLQEEKDKINKELNNKIEYLNCMLEQIDTLNKENDNLKKDLKQENSNNINLQRQISTLIDTNKRLNDWVNKILNEIGIKELHERTGVTIPCYIQDDRPIINNMSNVEYLHRQEIIIPELRFVKIGGK